MINSTVSLLHYYFSQISSLSIILCDILCWIFVIKTQILQHLGHFQNCNKDQCAHSIQKVPMLCVTHTQTYRLICILKWYVTSICVNMIYVLIMDYRDVWNTWHDGLRSPQNPTAKPFCGDRKSESHVFYTSRQAVIQGHYSTSTGKKIWYKTVVTVKSLI